MSTFVGLDVHLRTCHATVMDEQGKILSQEKFPNERRELERIFKDIDDAKVAMEACYCWQPVYELLESMGYEVRLAHPMKTRIIAEAKIKTDAIDSEALAHLSRANLLPTSYVPPKELRELRELVRLHLLGAREDKVQEQDPGGVGKARDQVHKEPLRQTKNSVAERVWDHSD